MVGTLQRAPSTGGGGPNGRPTTAYTITINSQSAASLDEAMLPLNEEKARHHPHPPHPGSIIVGGMGMGMGGGGGIGGGGGAGVAASPGTIVNVSTERFRLKLWGNFPPKNVGRHPVAQFFLLSISALYTIVLLSLPL